MDKRARVTSEALTLHDPRRFGAIFKSNLLPVALWHRDGRIRDANDAYLKLVGYSRQELRNGDLQCNHLTASDHHVRDERAILDLLSGRKLCVLIEKDYMSRARGRFPVVVGATLCPGRQDEGVAFALDLADYSSVEQALRRRKAPVSLGRTAPDRLRSQSRKALLRSDAF